MLTGEVRAEVFVTGLGHMLTGEVRAEVFAAGNVVAQLLDQGLHSGRYNAGLLYGWWLILLLQLLSETDLQLSNSLRTLPLLLQLLLDHAVRAPPRHDHAGAGLAS